MSILRDCDMLNKKSRECCVCEQKKNCVCPTACLEFFAKGSGRVHTPRLTSNTRLANVQKFATQKKTLEMCFA